ncbi:2Fe-2S iron-sulfur cluster binding domain-containing protein [Heliobacterium gestii]|uniref:2Fe-2S iron-sulfur cluster binding domain-containing protein n=2 Tax=Heliomicrobium gestii TaxID=2699 RepID=A0A845LCY8_HELGE|nr:2Fe-2S iron-sulfur cluster binding domain-containing protein [Heliomicrobium gestii]
MMKRHLEEALLPHMLGWDPGEEHPEEHTKPSAFFGPKKVRLEIDGQPVDAEVGATVLDAAREAGIHIPSLCYLREINEIGACRVCLVEVEGQRALQAACVYPVAEGLKVRTHSPRVRKARRRVVELILSDHQRECTTCIRNLNCELQNIAEDLGIRRIETQGEARRQPVQDNNPSIRHDPNKCVHCRRCESICAKVQENHVIAAQERGFDTIIAPAFNADLGDTACIMCGQCVLSCPVGALTEKESIDDVWKALADPTVHVVVQTAPSIQVTLGEAFGLPVGTKVTGKLVAALRRLGFDQVLATDFAADLTIVEEAYEFLGRFEEGRTPFFTSCCPAWIKLVEHYYPKYIPNLSTCKSPMAMFGALTRAHYHKERNLPPEKVISVAVMPCTAKKYEAARPEHGDGQRPDVDYVLTTRELVRMIREAGIDFKRLPDESFDSAFGEATGAGAIFGATGGVMEATLRTTSWVLARAANPRSLVDGPPPVEFREIRGETGLKLHHVKLADHDIHVAVAHGTGNARRVLEALEAGEKIDFIEVMACPGGCVGGGGQPILGGRDHKKISLDYRHDRADALYDIDSRKSLRYSHENPTVRRLYREILGQPGSELAKKLLHTHGYRERGRYPSLGAPDCKG